MPIDLSFLMYSIFFLAILAGFSLGVFAGLVLGRFAK